MGQSTWGVEAHSRKEKTVSFETLKMSSKVLLALTTFTFLAMNCLCYPGGFLDGLPGGIATRQKCPPKPPTIKEFNATEYLGIWYEQRRFPAFFQLNTRCVRATYGPCPDPNQPGACDDKPDRVSVLNVATKANGDLDTILGSAYVPDPEYRGELLVQFPGNPEGSYWILETDYHNYSVVYSCTDFLFGAIKLGFAWILAREKHLDPEMLEHATNVLVENGIDITPLEDTVQNEDCVYQCTSSLSPNFAPHV